MASVLVMAGKSLAYGGSVCEEKRKPRRFTTEGTESTEIGGGNPREEGFLTSQTSFGMTCVFAGGWNLDIFIEVLVVPSTGVGGPPRKAVPTGAGETQEHSQEWVCLFARG